MGDVKREHCRECDAETGKAGRADDSLYINAVGPFCEDCYDKRLVECAESVDANPSALSAAQARCERLEEALTPSGATKAAYIGEHKCDHRLEGHDPHLISWTVVKEIMAMIRARAALEEPKR